MNALRTQIIETQKARSDLMKWKLLVVAVLASAGFGAYTLNIPKIHLLLCFIPLICVYVDALCAHLNLRIRVIGAFFRSCRPTKKCEYECCDHEYELFLGKLRKSRHTQPLEFFALRWSSYVMSVFVFLYGLSFIWQKRVFSVEVMLIIAGLLGIIATARINQLRETEKKRIDNCLTKALGIGK